MTTKKKILGWLIFLMPLIVIILFFAFRRFFASVLPALIPPCPFYGLFGIYCLGCGGTRSAFALFSGNLLTALRQNALVPIGAFFLLLLEIQCIFHLLGKSIRLLPKSKLFWSIIVSLAFIYGILRNILPALMPF